MSAKLRTRTIYYRRANWLDGSQHTLETYLVGIHHHLSTTAQRTFQYQEGELQGLSWEHKSGFGAFFHVAEYIPHQPWTVVPFASRKHATNTGVQPPPDQNNFMQGDVFFLVSGDNILLCTSGAREAAAESYILHVMRAEGLDDQAAGFSMQAVANVDKIGMIKEQGVKSVELNASLYEATTQYQSRRNTRETVMHDISETFLSLFANDPNHELRDISNKENLQVKLLVTFDKRRTGDVGQERLNNIARELVNSGSDDGFTIITGENQRLKADEIRISQTFQFEPRGNSISRRDAWECLEVYFEDLQRMGILQQ